MLMIPLQLGQCFLISSKKKNLGTIAGEAEDGSEVYADILDKQEIDILIIDLLMPNRDGIETVREIAPFFHGKIIMISQVETKDLIGEAYSLRGYPLYYKAN